jgi:hypothetical protein
MVQGLLRPPVNHAILLHVPPMPGLLDHSETVQLHVEGVHRNALLVVSMPIPINQLLIICVRVLLQPLLNHVIQVPVGDGSGSWVAGRHAQPIAVVVRRLDQWIVRMVKVMCWVYCVCSNRNQLQLVPVTPRPVLYLPGKSILGNHVQHSVIMVLLLARSTVLEMMAVSAFLTTVLILNLLLLVYVILNNVVLLLIISGYLETGPTVLLPVVVVVSLVVSDVLILCPISLWILANVMVIVGRRVLRPVTLLPVLRLLGSRHRGLPALKFVMEECVFVM